MFFRDLWYYFVQYDKQAVDWRGDSVIVHLHNFSQFNFDGPLLSNEFIVQPMSICIDI